MAHHSKKSNWDFTGEALKSGLNAILQITGPKKNVIAISDNCAAQVIFSPITLFFITNIYSISIFFFH